MVPTSALPFRESLSTSSATSPTSLVRYASLCSEVTSNPLWALSSLT